MKTILILLVLILAQNVNADQNNPWDENYMSGRDCLDEHILATNPVQMWGDDVVGYFKTKEQYLNAYDISQEKVEVDKNVWTWSNGSRVWK